MLNYSLTPVGKAKKENLEVWSFVKKDPNENIDWGTVNSFGEEWTKFNFFTEKEIKNAGDQYFDIVENEILTKSTYVLDVGCGSGRWTKYICDKVGFVEAIDPSDAVFQALSLLKEKKNIRISQASVDNIPFADHTFDLVFSLGVLHHIPDTFGALKKCVSKVKPGGYFLVYLYYNLDNRNLVFKLLFGLSNSLRLIISKLPSFFKKKACDILAVLIYMPFVLLSRLCDNISLLNKFVKHIPLSYYRDKTFNIIRNDSLDRFGTPLEQRFSRKQIEVMLTDAGLYDLKFSDNEPFWHVIGKKR